MNPITADNFSVHFERLYSRYGARLYNYVLTMTNGDRYLAEEITQSAFLELWEHRDSIRSLHALESYLFSAARSLFFNLCRRDAVKHVYYNYLHATQSIEDNTTENQIDETFLAEYIEGIISEMPPIRKQVFTMSRYHNMTRRQIADTLGLSITTIDTHLMLALHFIRRQLAARYGIHQISQYPDSKDNYII